MQAQLDWLADYHESLADRPVMAKNPGPARFCDALPAQPPNEAGRFPAQCTEDLNRIVLPGLSLWQHPRFFGYFPRQRAPRRNSGRYGQHRARCDRALVAILEPGGDGDRGSRHRLAAADAWTLSGFQRRDPGHCFDQHAGRALSRARERATNYALARGGSCRARRASPRTSIVSAHAP